MNLHISVLCGITTKLIFSLFRHALSNADVDEYFTSDDVDEACTMLTDTFLNTAKAHVPNKVGK